MAIETDLASTLAKLEAARMASLSKVKITTAATVVFTGCGALYFHLTDSPHAMVVALALVAVVAVAAISHLIGKVKRAFKREIMPLLLRGIDPSLSYHDSRCIFVEDFKGCGLFKNPDRYSGKDLIEGHVGETAVRFSLVHAEEEYEDKTTDSDGHTKAETHYRTIFRGLFFIADFNKHFAGRTFVKPQEVNFISKLFGSHVALEDPDFNRFFTVNSTDQVEARYIMTPSLMERLKALRTKIGAFHASFFLGSLHMAIEMPNDAFEPSMMRSLEESGQVERILVNLRTITGIVEDLGLNIRIWTKTGDELTRNHRAVLPLVDK